MRTTIRLDEELLKEAKSAAAASGRSFTELVADALRETLSRRKPEPRKPVKLHTYGQGGLRPGVDINDSAALLDLMEGLDAPS
jgi:hypothetical protein